LVEGKKLGEWKRKEKNRNRLEMGGK